MLFAEIESCEFADDIVFLFFSGAMNFLMRSTSGMYGPVPAPEPRSDTHQRSVSAGSSLETLVTNDPYAHSDAKVDFGVINKHSDVDEEEGWITIPCSISSLHLSFSCLFSIIVDTLVWYLNFGHEYRI